MLAKTKLLSAKISIHTLHLYSDLPNVYDTNYESLPLVTFDSSYRKQVVCTRTNDLSRKPSLTIQVRSKTFAICSVILKRWIRICSPKRKQHIEIYFSSAVSYRSSLLQALSWATSRTVTRELSFISALTEFI